MSPREDEVSIPRRDFLKRSVAAGVTVGAAGVGAEGAEGAGAGPSPAPPARAAAAEPLRAAPGARKYSSAYSGEHLDRIAFPMGGMGAGMICLEGTGALSHFSIRNRPEVFNEPPV